MSYSPVKRIVSELNGQVTYKVVYTDKETKSEQEYEPCFVGGEGIWILWPDGKKTEFVRLSRRIEKQMVESHGQIYEVKSYLYGFKKNIYGAEVWIEISHVRINFFNRQPMEEIKKPALGDRKRAQALGRMR
jgi:hypothetical protein